MEALEHWKKEAKELEEKQAVATAKREKALSDQLMAVAQAQFDKLHLLMQIFLLSALCLYFLVLKCSHFCRGHWCRLRPQVLEHGDLLAGAVDEIEDRCNSNWDTLVKAKE